MEIVTQILTIAKYALILLLVFVAVKAYEYIYVPWKIRRKYLKYTNVKMVDRYYPLLGDIKVYTKNAKENKFIQQNYIDAILENPDIDIYVAQLGQITRVYPWSFKAFNEFEALVPDKIDRDDHKGVPFGDIAPGSFGVLPSNRNWDQRRKVIMKTVGINFASQYIPLMNQAVDEWILEIEINKELDFSFEMSKITFKVITKILFGKDIDKMGWIEYVSPHDGSKKALPFIEFYSKILSDSVQTFFSAKGKMIPFLAKLKLIEPFKSNDINFKSLFKAAQEFLDLSEDEGSVYRLIVGTDQISKEEVFSDIMLLLVAGFDTTSHAITSILYQLKKSPSKLQKLVDELEAKGLNNVDPLDTETLKRLYEECDYLNYVIKEGLRIDPPATVGLKYQANQDVTLCGVHFEKGTIFGYSIIMPHYNPRDWHEPEEFIPERFDPESKYFYKPGTETSRDPKSYIPFSTGIRNWAGQTLSKLEIKTVLSRLLLKIEYEINADQLVNNYAKFSIASQMKLLAKVTKIK